jgi:hypothetical protein
MALWGRAQPATRALGLVDLVAPAMTPVAD